MTSSNDPPPALLQRSNRNRNYRDPTIRHSGRAHIRGKIRRVWRPRYLELVRNTNELDLIYASEGIFKNYLS